MHPCILDLYENKSQKWNRLHRGGALFRVDKLLDLCVFSNLFSKSNDLGILFVDVRMVL